MGAMVLEQVGLPLLQKMQARPAPAPGQLLLAVEACGVCRTDLHVVDGDLPDPKLPLVPGHEIVGKVVEVGSQADRGLMGRRVGVPWLGWTCGKCDSCVNGRENLCDQARFTGYQIDGGYANWAVADARYCFEVDGDQTASAIAPLLCAGLIGYRALRMAGDAQRLGIYGFGAAAHIVAQLARWQGRDIYAFTRAGDVQAQDFARSLGAAWAGSSDEAAPLALDAALIFAPVGSLVPAALRATTKGGTVVCAGIHMTDIPAFPYRILWEERVVRSVANLTRRDALEFFPLAAKAGITTHTVQYPLEQANAALADLREGRLRGAAVLVP